MKLRKGSEIKADMDEIESNRWVYSSLQTERKKK